MRFFSALTKIVLYATIWLLNKWDISFADNDEGVKQAISATSGFTFLLAGRKAFLEHGIALNLSADSHPEDL